MKNVTCNKRQLSLSTLIVIWRCYASPSYAKSFDKIHLDTTAAALYRHKAVAMLLRYNLGRVSRLRHVGAKSDSASDTEERKSGTDM